MENKLKELESILKGVGADIAKLDGQKAALSNELSKTVSSLAETEEEYHKNKEGHALISQSIQVMYESLSAQLGDIITEGIRCVFPDSPYIKFVIEFVPRRDNVEADLYLIDRNGEKYHPMDAVGGGVADLIAILLRITYIKLSRNDNLLVADEPLKFVDRSRVEDAAKFIHQVCKDLDFSLLLVTHIPELIKVADAIYKVVRKNEISSVQLIHTER